MSLDTPLDDNYFIRFRESIESVELPQRFTFPFHYEPHPLCRLAAKELQQHLLTQTDWIHDFGIDHPVEGTNIGKMFGVMIVQNQQNEIGYLAAFSGKLAGKNIHPHFVPPIVDLLCEDGFYRKGEDEISAINHRIKAIEASEDYLRSKAEFEFENQQALQELEQYRRQMKMAKQARDKLREQATQVMSADEMQQLKEKLKNESLKWQYDYKQLVIHWNARLAQRQQKHDAYVTELAHLKDARKIQSADLQQRMFNQYQFLSYTGHTKSVGEIFAATEQKIPPAGAGDCAGPKMLQYAYLNQLQPLAMAEFWWGQSPKSEIRQHGQFYPACRGKCQPILGHMLQGLKVDVNPVLLPPPEERKLEIVFEDEAILIINKPAEYLSVPGKTDADSVYRHIRQHYPHADGPLIVHRLDMSTSGLMVIAKTTEAYHHLQNQFLNRTVKKRYIALLEGIVANDEGTIDLPLRVDLDDRPRQLVCYDYGKQAITHWKVLDRSNSRTRIQFTPITGRTHQLRVHSAHQQGLNCPIVGDDLYGQKQDRLHLHAGYLEFTHPLTHEVMRFQVEAGF